MGDPKRRIEKLEQALAPSDQEIHVTVNWENDDLVEDYATGERVTEEEWRKRHPGEGLIRVRWDDDDDTETD